MIIIIITIMTSIQATIPAMAATNKRLQFLEDTNGQIVNQKRSTGAKLQPKGILRNRNEGSRNICKGKDKKHLLLLQDQPPFLPLVKRNNRSSDQDASIKKTMYSCLPINDNDDNEFLQDEHQKQLVDRLKHCLELHSQKEQSHPRLFQVGRLVPTQTSGDDQDKSKNPVSFCIACAKCSEKIVIVPANKEEEEESSLDNKRQAQKLLLQNLEHHETKHYLISAKVFLFLIEAFMVMIVNYYGQ